MTTVTVSASKEYDILIGSGLLAQAGSKIAALGKIRTAAVVSDSNVWPLYGVRLCRSLEEAGIKALPFVVPAGEQSKSGTGYLQLLNFLARSQLTRSDCLVALGGGVVGDLTGFAAATYLRGLRYVQIPTSLLAAVDSSVGGKTAIDLEAGKNLAGAFWQPSLVLCDTDTLRSLPRSVFRDGCAEVIKYAILYDPDLFRQLQASGPEFDRESVIARCVTLKRDVVMEDEFDTGARQKLNLGHTIGHGIEAESRFTVSHGQAVAMGTVIAARISEHLGLCSPETRGAIVSILKQFGLPVWTELPAEILYTYTLSDKKRSGGALNLILPEKIGSCCIRSTPLAALQQLIKAGLQPWN